MLFRCEVVANFFKDAIKFCCCGKYHSSAVACLNYFIPRLVCQQYLNQATSKNAFWTFCGEKRNTALTFQPCQLSFPILTLGIIFAKVGSLTLQGTRYHFYWDINSGRC